MYVPRMCYILAFFSFSLWYNPSMPVLPHIARISRTTRVQICVTGLVVALLVGCACWRVSHALHRGPRPMGMFY